MRNLLLSTAWCASLLAIGAPASAQTAADINRLNAAIQVCNSPAGAGLAECAQLRGKLGMGAPQMGGFGGGHAGGGGATANILGALNAAMTTRQPAPSLAPVAPAANSQAIATCVRAAGADNAAIQACLNQVNAPRLSAPTLTPGVPSLGQPLLPTAQRNLDTATAIHQGAQSYQACAAANPTNWQSCLPLLNGGQSR